MSERLVEMSVFPTPPDGELVMAFRKHVGATGQPETFHNISTARPPKDGELIVLHHPIDIERGKRPDSDMAPCPICSPGKPKYLTGGTLIWCEATQAIYAIGPKCSVTLWEDGRLNRAVNLYLQTESAKANASGLVAALALIPAQRTWISNHRSMAEKAERYQKNFAKQAPKLRGALSRGLRSKTAATAQIKGDNFLRGSWKLTNDLDMADLALGSAITAAGEDSEAYVLGLTPSGVSERLSKIKSPITTLKRTADRMADAAAFLSAKNCEHIGKWGASGTAPMSFKATYTASSIDLKTVNERWVGPLGLLWPSPLP